MATRIMRGEWVIEGKTREELQLGIEAVELALAAASGSRSGSRSGTRSRSVSSNTPGRRGPGRPRKVQPVEAQDNGKPSAHGLALAFLGAIVHGGQKGVPTDALLRPLGASHPKGIGNAVAKIKALLTALDFEPDSVFSATKRPGEAKLWFPGTDIESALDKIAAAKT